MMDGCLPRRDALGGVQFVPILRILPPNAAGQRSRPCRVCHREIRPGKTGLCSQCWQKGELKAEFFEAAREQHSGPLCSASSESPRSSLLPARSAEKSAITHPEAGCRLRASVGHAGAKGQLKPLCSPHRTRDRQLAATTKLRDNRSTPAWKRGIHQDARSLKGPDPAAPD